MKDHKLENRQLLMRGSQKSLSGRTNQTPKRLGYRKRWVTYLRMLVIISSVTVADRSMAGTSINAATANAAGSPVTISNSTPTKLLNANTAGYGWTIYCGGTAGTIAALVMPGDSAGDPASPAPSQTVGFPIPANTLVTNMDFPLRGLDSIHQRIDAEAQGGAQATCYTWEEQ